jgi:hypothetical protein
MGFLKRRSFSRVRPNNIQDLTPSLSQPTQS